MNLLSAYYFRAHMYTIIPRHVREPERAMDVLRRHLGQARLGGRT